MAKRKRTDDESDETEGRDEREVRPEDEAQIAVDYGDGTGYHIIKAPGGVPRALVTVVDGQHMQHVDEHEGLWAYRNLDPVQPTPPEPPPPPEPEPEPE